MEKAQHGKHGFFFAETTRRLYSFFQRTRKEFADLFGSVESVESGTHQVSARYQLHQRIKDRERQRIFLANYLPLHIPLEGLSLYEYYFYLNEAVKDTQKKNKQANGTGSNTIQRRHK
jgi:hypothetical protein